MNARAEAESKDAISDRSAPPMKAFPAPVIVTARRSLWTCMSLRVEGICLRRGVFRAFSFVGRIIVRWAILPLAWCFRVVWIILDCD